VTETIHASLAEHNLLPAQHVADTGYVNSALLVSSRTTYQIELIGPTRGDNHWQATDGGGLPHRISGLIGNSTRLSARPAR
jgi:transposase